MVCSIHGSLANTIATQRVEVEVTEFQVGDSLVKEGAIIFVTERTAR